MNTTPHDPAACACDAGRLPDPSPSLARAIVDDGFALAIVLGAIALAWAAAGAIVAAAWIIRTVAS